MKKTKFTEIILFIIIFCLISLPVFAWEVNGDVITINTSKSDNNEVIIKGNVCIKNKDMQISGDNASYYTDREEILVNGHIKVLSGDYNLTGDKLEGNLSTGQLKIINNASAKGPKLLLQSGIINYNNKSGIMIFQKNPVMKYKSLTASADKITFYKDDKKALLTGNVKGNRDGQEFVSDNLTINMAEEQIKLSGKARLIFSDGGDS